MLAWDGGAYLEPPLAASAAFIRRAGQVVIGSGLAEPPGFGRAARRVVGAGHPKILQVPMPVLPVPLIAGVSLTGTVRQLDSTANTREAGILGQ